MSYAWRTPEGDWIEIVGEVVLPGGGEDASDVRVYPLFVENLGPGVRALRGFVEVVEADPPTDAHVVGRSVEDVDGVPTRAWQIEAFTLDELKAARIQAVRDLRATKEVGGIVVGGTPIRTDEKSQAKLNGAVSLFALDPAKTQVNNWEAVPGVFVTLQRAQIEAIGLAVGAHIQACFDRSADLCRAISEAEDAAAVSAIDITAGWPA